MALNLIEIKDFPKTASLTGAGEEIIPVSKADGKTYGIKTSDLKAFLGTVQVVAPKALSPTDPAPTLDGVYIPTVTQNEAGTPITYTNAGGLTVNTAEGGEDYGKAPQLINNGGVWVKSSYPLPAVSNLTAMADDSKGVISIISSNNTVEFITPFAVTNGKVRYVLSSDTVVNLINSFTSLLYITSSGDIEAVDSRYIGSIPLDALIFAQITKITAEGDYSVTGISNYSIDGAKMNPSRNAQLINSHGSINFDTTANLLKIGGGCYFYFGQSAMKLLVPSDIPISTSGYRRIVSDMDGNVRSTQVSLPIRKDEVTLFSYIRDGDSSVVVGGLENYVVNGIRVNYPIKTKLGIVMSFTKNFNLNRTTLKVGSAAIVIYEGKRHNVVPHELELDSNPCFIYYSVIDSIFKKVATTNISGIPVNDIIIGGSYGVRDFDYPEVYGIGNYLVNDKPIDYISQRQNKKLLVDFVNDHYYENNTILSMTSDDSEVLKTSMPNIVIDRYESLMAGSSGRITKTVLASVPTNNGAYPLSVYTFTPPTITPVFADGEVNITQPHIFIQCSTHGSEKTSSIACYLFMKDIVERKDECKVCEWFYYNIKLSIIPVANPQGWVNDTRTNGNLVDLNRNYPYQYIANQNSGTEQWSGLAALDQIETKAIHDYIIANKGDIHAAIDFHNFWGTSASSGDIMWTEGVNKYTCNIGRIAAQRVSRGSRSRSALFPVDDNIMLGIASYPSNTRGRSAGWFNYELGYGLTFEVSANFRYDPAHKENDNNCLKFSAEAFGNFLNVFTMEVISDFNQKNNIY